MFPRVSVHATGSVKAAPTWVENRPALSRLPAPV